MQARFQNPASRIHEICLSSVDMTQFFSVDLFQYRLRLCPCLVWREGAGEYLWMYCRPSCCDQQGQVVYEA